MGPLLPIFEALLPVVSRLFNHGNNNITNAANLIVVALAGLKSWDSLANDISNAITVLQAIASSGEVTGGALDSLNADIATLQKAQQFIATLPATYPTTADGWAQFAATEVNELVSLGLATGGEAVTFEQLTAALGKYESTLSDFENNQTAILYSKLHWGTADGVGLALTHTALAAPIPTGAVTVGDALGGVT